MVNPIRRLLNLLLCLLLALNGAALAHAGASAGDGHGGSAGGAQGDAASVDIVRADIGAHAVHANAPPPCHEAPEPAASHEAIAPATMPDGSAATAAPCCDDTATTCDHACVPAVAFALLSERAAPAAGRLGSAVPMGTVQSRAPPPGQPPIRPPIAA